MRFVLYVLFACFSSILSAQAPQIWQIKAIPENPKVGQTVVLEVADLIKSSSVTIDWNNQGGEGEGVWVEKSGVLGKFTPTKPGGVTIVCILSGGLTDEIHKELQVSGDATGPSKQEPAVPAVAQPSVGVLPQQQPAPNHHFESLPPDGTAMNKIVDSKDAQVIPTGAMGDALALGVVSLVGAVDCKFDVDCHSLTYDVPNRKEGWVAFAWQVVPQGQKWNWGEYKGADLSNSGFRSLRVSAKSDPRFGVFPKVEFKSGGNIDPKFAATHPDSYLVSTGMQPLTADWHEFCLDISHASSSALKDVVSPLTVVVSSLYNPETRLGFFIDGVYFSKRQCGH